MSDSERTPAIENAPEVKQKPGNSGQRNEAFYNVWGELRVIELSILLVLLASHTVLFVLIEKVVNPANSAATCAGIAVLALYVLLIRDPRQHPITYVLFEVVLVAITSAFGITRLFTVMYMVAIAKGALMLPPAAQIFCVAFALTAFTAAKELSWWLLQSAELWLSPSAHLAHLFIFGRLPNVALALVFSTLCIYSLRAEIKARLEREALNRKVEEFATIAERTRIAREIHDHVGHSLTGLKMQIEIARRSLAGDREKCGSALRKAIELASEARRELTKAVADKREDTLDLAAELQALADELRHESQLNVSIEIDDDYVSIPASIGHQLQSVSKEALNNIKKYANAKNVSISARLENDTIAVTIEDDGRGFARQDVGTTSFGLKGMQERMALVSGTIEIASSPGKGTRIIAAAPRTAAMPEIEEQAE
ncbi:MAG TPA: sensor histidine kinase [Candidatus Obscuribacterales bacterium]